MATITPADRTAPPEIDVEKKDHVDQVTEINDDLKSDSDSSSAHKQDGVKKVEAVTSVWTKKTLIIMFVLLYLVSFVDMLIVGVQTNLNPYVTSAFSQHGLLATTSIVASILGGSSSLAMAKLIDIWGRTEGFMAMLLLVTIGLIMKATCQNVATYAAAHTLYWTGHLNLLYVIDVVIADMTSLRNRMLMLTLNGTPTIASTFAGPAIAELFHTQSNFRWAFGAFCIILLGFGLPTSLVLLLNQRKAAKFGMLPEKTHDRTPVQSIKHYVLEFDVVGIILITAAFSLILLPFSLASSSGDKWASASIITMIVMGVFSLVLFIVHERFWAPVPFMPFHYLKERTIIGSCILYGVMFISIFCWDAYYSSYLQVVHNQSITHAGYILNSFSLTSSFISPFVGLLIRHTGEFKWTSYAGLPFVVLGTALLIPLRQPSTHVGLLVMCQVFMGIGTGIWATCGQLAVMASVSHQQIAVAIAIWGLFGSIGASVGLTIAGGLWTNVLPAALVRELPEGSKDLAASIYSSLVIQQEYPIGTEIRDAIIRAYADVQRKMVIAGAGFIPVLLIAIFMWKNINVKKLEEARGTQTKGTIW